MTKLKPSRKLLSFDAARYLTDDAAVADYVNAVLELNDPDLLLLALDDIARARGMAQVAKDAGLGREHLYKALAPGAKPRLEYGSESRACARRQARSSRSVGRGAEPQKTPASW